MARQRRAQKQRLELALDPSEHPLLAAWVRSNPWRWPQAMRDAMELELREGRVSADLGVPARSARRQRTPPPQDTAPAAAPPATEVVSVPPTLAPPSAAPDESDRMQLIRAALYRNVF